MEKKFNEYSTNNIGYEEFRDFVTPYNGIVKEILNPFLEKVKKRLRETGLNTEKELLSNFLFIKNKNKNKN